MNFHMFKLVLDKAEEPEIKLPTSTGSWKKPEHSRKTSISALLTMPKPLTVWITVNCESSERDGNTRPPDLPLEKSICRSGSVGSQREESHPWQGHAERPDGQGESGLRVSPWNFLSMYPPNQNLPALLYCAFPLFWHTLERVNSGLLLTASCKRSVSAQTPLMAL